jgi:hypothetical protein|tara:strand:+ start:1116 stop:1769 length:654 start_codon:yes stop_codon:yes gene_type:complete
MAKATEDKKKKIMTPEGRLINGSLWTKDVYTPERGKEGTPQYKVEMAFNPDDLEELENAIVACAVEEWGEDAEQEYDDGDIRSPILDGDEMAKKREKKGKSGEAYQGFDVIRAATIYNAFGDDDSGGIYVADAAAEQMTFEERGKVYNGSYGIAILTPNAYEMEGRDGTVRGVSLYLQAYQFTRDGDPLRGSNAGASMFTSKVNEESEGKGRRRRGK